MLPFAGFPSFARAQIANPEENWHSDVGVLGVPFDTAVGFRPGARFAPRSIREASLRYALSPDGFYDLQTNQTRLKNLNLRDAGDVNVPSLEDALARERIEQAARNLRTHCTLPIFLGGDHSISYPILRSYDDVENLHVVQLDAHLDFTDSRNSTRFSNSSPFRRACEALPNLIHITTIGLRGLRFDQEAVEAARARGHTLIAMQEAWDTEKVLAQLPKNKNVYISFDADVLDPSFFPATSSPEPDGMGYAQAMQILAATCQHNNIVGLDFVECTPHLDASGNSSLFAARLLMQTLAVVFG